MDKKPLHQSRQCGPCTECCRGWLNHKQMQLSPGNPCQHCTRSGCAIYESRPEDPCRRFRCGWLSQPDEFPSDMRPDLSGAIVVTESNWNDWRVMRAVAAGHTIPPDTLEWLKAYATRIGEPMIFTEHLMEAGRFSGWRQRGFGPPEFARAVQSAISPEDLFF